MSDTFSNKVISVREFKISEPFHIYAAFTQQMHIIYVGNINIWDSCGFRSVTGYMKKRDLE